MFKITNNKGIIMELKKLDYDFTVFKVKSTKDVDINAEFSFVGKTDEECSLVCITSQTPTNTIEREDGWKGFRIQGILDFSLIGILAKISAVLAENSVGIFVVSTFNTDYIFVKKENFQKAEQALALKGYKIV